MVDPKSILDLSERIVRKFHPQKIILFGSYAYGEPTSDSDVDLLVVLPFAGKDIQKAAEMLNQISPRIPVELVVRTPEQIQQRLQWNDFFLREIMEKGKVLYESAHS